MAEDRAEPFPYLDAIKHLPRGLKVLKHVLEKERLQNVAFLSVLKNEPCQLVDLQQYMSCRLLVIQQMKGRCWVLRYDGRFLKNVDHTLPLQIWLFGMYGNLIAKKNSIESCPKLRVHNTKFISKQKPLWQLLGLYKPVPDPTNYEEAITFLTKEQKLDKVSLFFCYASGHRAHGQFWNLRSVDGITIDVFTTKDYSLGFRYHSFPGVKEQKASISEQVVVSTTPNETQANRSSAVSVKLTGLNLAYNLGLLSITDMQYLSKELGKCTASIWLEYDDKLTARYVTVNALGKFLQVEIKNEESWQKVFHYIDKIKHSVTKKKSTILQSVIKTLSQAPKDKSSLFKKCLNQLEACIKHLKVVVYSEDDTVIHGIKFHLANYLLKRDSLKFRGIALNANAKNEINMLRTSEMTFFNLNIYLKDGILPSDALTAPNIKSQIKDLQNQSKDPATNMTILAKCKKRGQQIAPALLSSWQSIGHFFMNEFETDIFSTYFVSLSLLAFQNIWTKYSRSAGIFHHALEKTKVAYEDTFRSFSHGGYAFSCQDKLKVGEPIHGYKPTNFDLLGSDPCTAKSIPKGEPAATILQLDIISSYGFGGSHIQTPKGFCNGFVNTGDGILKSCEPVARHQTFEFLSVYYTLWLLDQQSLKIRTVYSNFHQSGIFSIANYPIDLTVICEDGTIMMYQFDGQYAHGCKQGCEPLYSYIHGQTSEELEAATTTRDLIISDWVAHLNWNKVWATYHVITNCHHKDYNITALKHSFAIIPVLSDIIAGYPTSKNLTKDDVLFSSDDLTYIIIAEGYIPGLPGNLDPLKALILRKDGNNWERHASTDNGPMLLTKDYLQWLMKCFNFQVTTIHKVYFYKKCDVLNSIFQHLTRLRMTPGILPCTKQLVKNVINYAAGYFGLNERKSQKVKYKLVSKIGSHNTRKHMAECAGSIGSEDFYLKSFTKPQSVKVHMGSAPIPIFVAIVEFGKFRMSQILCFFDKFLLHSRYRHLYSNIDNVLIALSTPNLDEAVNPAHWAAYNDEKSCILTENQPGHLKQEFEITSEQNWSFVSPMTMNFSIITEDSKLDMHKNSSINGVTSVESYETGIKLLQKQMVKVNQVRRVNKIMNKDLKNVTYVFNKN